MKVCSDIEGTRLRCDVGFPLFVARALGLKYYFSGYRCDEGHRASFRKTSDKRCMECIRIKDAAAKRNLPPEEKRRRHHAWKQRNPYSYKAKKARKRARRRGATGTHTPDDLKLIFKAQKGRCAYFRTCKTRLGDDYHVDHIMPICQGGTNDRPNIQLTCPACNWSKNDQHPVDFAQSLGLLI